MDEIIQQYKKEGRLHHFYILIGDKQKTSVALQEFYQTEFSPGNDFVLNFIHNDFDLLLVDDARKISERSVIKTKKDSKTVFCLSFNNINKQAQNALLKVVEEPTSETYFFLICPRKNIFIPTILSRAIIVDGIQPKNNSILKELTEMSIADRVKWADGIATDVKKGKIEKGNVDEIIWNLIYDLEKKLFENDGSEQEKILQTIKNLKKITSYLNDNSSAIKMLLEKVALIIQS